MCTIRNMKQRLYILILFVFLSLSVTTAEASIFSKTLDKARNAMQSAFQMSFLSKLPVIFYKDSFNEMFEYTHRTINELDYEYNGVQVTRNEFQDDKALHITKSTELALHLKSLLGSKHLAYILTVSVGILKEVIDGSFLNPNGSRSVEDIRADIVGARAVYGKEAFDRSLDKYMYNFVKPGVLPPEEKLPEPDRKPYPFPEEEQETNYHYNDDFGGFVQENDLMGSQQKREQLMQQYYKAAQAGDAQAVKRISEELQNLK